MVQLRKGLVSEVKSEILQVCQRRNAIVRLDTGMGKTFVAVMLIRWLTSLPRESSMHKLCVFLVPTVALVDQQSETLANQTPLKVRPYRGDMGVDFWDREKWQKELAEADCVVMTAEIWKNVLLHAYWTLDQVLVMVFDECHHAQKNHPYNKIMQEYHRYKAERQEKTQGLPHILGLTASPIFNPDDPHEQFKELEANLDAVLVNVREAKLEAEGYVTRPKERAVYFSSHTAFQAETDFEAQLDELEIWDFVNQDKVRDRILNIKRTLGDLACNVYIMNWLQSLCDPTATKTSLHAIRASGRIPDVERLYQNMIQDIAKLPYYGLGDVSDKVRALVRLLESYRDKRGFQCIVFVEQRHHAQALAMILSKSQSLQTFIRAAYFVGHGATGDERLASEGMDAKIQRRTVADFRAGKVNVLVATNVAEEGLDFQACNLIVRFDFMPTYKGYIQSRGRARKKDSEFVVMLAHEEPAERDRWRGYVAAEKQLKRIYDEREIEDDVDEPDLEITPRLRVEETGAVLTYGSSIALLDEACALLPTDAYSPPARPRYEMHPTGKAYYWKVYLPMMPLLGPDDREVHGPELPTKRAAKQAAAFDACKMLFHRGVLDKHLLPIREGRGDNARDADDVLVDRAVLPLHMDYEVPNVFGNLWSDELQPVIWVNEVNISFPGQGVERFAVICGERLDLWEPLNLYEPGLQFEVNVRAIRSHSWKDEERTDKLARLDTFTRWVIKQTINRKLIQGPMLYLIAPLSIGTDGTYDIDWGATDNPVRSITKPEALRPGNLVIAPWQFMRKHIFTIHEIRKDLNPRNMPRISGFTKLGRIFDRTGNYGDALIALLDYENVDIRELDFDEWILHLKPWFNLRNNLNPIKERQAGPAGLATDPRAFDDSLHEGRQSLPRGNAVVKPQPADDEDDYYVPPWELPDWKWRQYKVKQYEMDEDALDGQDPIEATSALLPLPAGQTIASHRDVTVAFALPWSLCKISNISIGVWNAWSWLPSLMRGISDRVRTQICIQRLGLPRLDAALAAQALTLPMCCVGKDYQTLETIGDSALKLAVTVHVYNRFTSKDEGGLSARRMNSIDNQHLRMKAVSNGLPQHLLTDFFKVRTWVPPTVENDTLTADGLKLRRTIPRRALSDCIESLLGAAYLSGGFDAVIRTGDALGLCFGGPRPWHERYRLSGQVREMPVGVGLLSLQEILGYRFKHGQLLTQAVTHRSFGQASTHCQEREEFLGDAVLDNFVIDRLSRRFPTASPSHLTRLRSTLVSNSALGYLALRFLGLHKYILHSTPLLSQHFDRALEEAMQLVHDDFVSEIWLFDPPKPAADALEGIIGSMFIDCGWQLEPVFQVLDGIFASLFQLLPDKESAPRDPTSRLRLYLQYKRCTRIDIKAEPRPDLQIPAHVTVTWHDQELARIQHHSQASAKQLASKVALASVKQLDDEAFRKICTCTDDLAERIGDITSWKKGILVDLRANKKLAAQVDLMDVEDAMFEDLGREEDRLRETRELVLEQIMVDTFGYNPDSPDDAYEDDARLASAARDVDLYGDQPADGAGDASGLFKDTGMLVKAASDGMSAINTTSGGLTSPAVATAKLIDFDDQDELFDEADDDEYTLVIR